MQLLVSVTTSDIGFIWNYNSAIYPLNHLQYVSHVVEIQMRCKFLYGSSESSPVTILHKKKMKDLSLGMHTQIYKHQHCSSISYHKVEWWWIIQLNDCSICFHYKFRGDDESCDVRKLGGAWKGPNCHDWKSPNVIPNSGTVQFKGGEVACHWDRDEKKIWSWFFWSLDCRLMFHTKNS